MAFGISRHGYFKLTQLANTPHKFSSVSISIRMWREFSAQSAGWIATQGDDVVDACRLVCANDCVHIFLRLAHTGEVACRLEAGFGRELCQRIKSSFLCRASSTNM